MPSPLEILASLVSAKSTSGLVRDAGKRVDAAVDAAQAGVAPAVPAAVIPATTYTPGAAKVAPTAAQVQAYQNALAKHLLMGQRVKAAAEAQQ